MQPEPKCWAVVPARAGSQGVPRKNRRVLNGIPLAGLTLEAARQSGVFADVFLSSDDSILKLWADLHGFKNLHRPSHLSGERTTIAELVRFLVEEYELEGIIAVLQPTSPLRSAGTIREAFDLLSSSDADSLMSVSESTSLAWLVRSEGQGPEPLFSSRLNRQFARHRLLIENGAIQFVKTSVLLSHGQMTGRRHELFVMPKGEGLDIDDEDDFLAASLAMSRGVVIFRVRANRWVGSGHLFQCLQIANQMRHHDVLFLLKDSEEFATTILTQEGFSYEEEDDLPRQLERWTGRTGKVVVNDVLDTTLHDIHIPRQQGFKVVCVEDLGAGPEEADWVINALYPPIRSNKVRISTGASWTALRPEFRMGLRRRSEREGAPLRVLVMFGGTDAANLSRHFAEVLGTHDWLQVKRVPSLSETPSREDGHEPVPFPRDIISDLLSTDVILTSSGRTVLEAAATGVPTIAIAQNEREASHSHLRDVEGITFLGMHSDVSDESVLSALRWYHEHPALLEQHSIKLQESLDVNGVDRIVLGIESLLRGIDFPRHI